MRLAFHGWTRTLILCTLVSLFVLPTAKATEPHYEIIINIPAFSLHLYQDGTPVATYPIGVGRVVNPSQLGPTQVINEVDFPTYYPPDWYAQGLQPIPPGPENPVGTRWLGLGFRGYGIHGTNAPETIGTAASAGCVRMHNEDVEELARSVGVGTSVTFKYETIESWLDPVTRRPYLRVHRDIYRQGTNTLSAALEALSAVGVNEGVDQQTLGAILGEAAGVPRPVPTSVPLYLGEERAPVNAVSYGGHLLIPLQGIARLTRDEVFTSTQDNGARVWVSGREVGDVFWIGQRPYATVASVADALGLMLLSATEDGVRMQEVRLLDDDGRDLGIRTYATNSRLLLPVQELSARHGVSATWDASLAAVRLGETIVFGAEVIGSKAYMPHDLLADHLGIHIAWRPQEVTATVNVVQVEIASATSERGLMVEGSLYVPLRPITEHLGYTLGWNQDAQTAYVRGRPVQGLVRDGRIYAALDALQGVIPPFDYVWNEEELRLKLDIGEPTR